MGMPGVMTSTPNDSNYNHSPPNPIAPLIVCNPIAPLTVWTPVFGRANKDTVKIGGARCCSHTGAPMDWWVDWREGDVSRRSPW